MYSDKTHLGTISILINNSFFDTNSLPNWYQHFQHWFIMALMYFITMGKHAKNTRNNVFATKLKLMDGKKYQPHYLWNRFTKTDTNMSLMFQYLHGYTQST